MASVTKDENNPFAKGLPGFIESSPDDFESVGRTAV